jgi:glutamate dehydrogenase/leucine dehydrogenase
MFREVHRCVAQKARGKMEKIKVAVVGMGNVGRYVLQAVR